jgi:translation initiation factor IF-2
LAKNLKLNVKNTQLAEALKLSTLKKPAVGKKKSEPAPEVKEAEPRETESHASAESAAAPVQAELPPAAPIAASPPPAAVTPPTPAHAGHGASHGANHVANHVKTAPAETERRPAETHHHQQQHHHHHHTPRPASSTHTPYPRREGAPYSRPYSPSPSGHPGQHPGQWRREGPPSSSRPMPPRRDFRPGGPSAGPMHRGAPPQLPPKPPLRSPPPAKKVEDASSPHKGPFKEYKDFKSVRKTAAQISFDSRDKQGLRDTDDQQWRKRRSSQKMRPQYEEPVIRPKSLKVRLPISVKDLAAEMKLKASQLISKLFMQGTVLTLNDMLDDETVVQLLGHEFDCEISIDTSEEQRIRITDKTIKQEVAEADADALVIRPPIVTFMGHVDHGKTSLIDAIRKSNVAAGEAGAITQHIGAFTCHTAVGDLTILDTPGHEAFSEMRARGADVTDIVVLVIAGDEGIRTQTLEAIKQAQDANVPMVVAINKSDKHNFNAENIYKQLADHSLLPEVWGGSVITVSCSALTGQGIKELLEMLALQAEILELKANPETRARGSVIESEMHKGMGAVATILVQNGKLVIGDALVFAEHWARVKTMQNEHGKNLTVAGPSTPVKITGLSGLPEAGSEFIAVKNENEARDLAQKRSEGQKRMNLQLIKKPALEGLLQHTASSAAKKVLNVILRADVQGSLEALKTSLMKIQSTKVDLNIITSGIGEISESDIQLAAASKAVIVGFHTQIEVHAEKLIRQTKVKVRTHDIIYHAVDDVKELMRELLDKIPQENDIGTALVKTTFKASHLGVIAGCQVTDGLIKRNHHIRQIRDGKVIWKGTIHSLKREKEDTREVSKGYECGILLQNNNDVKAEDILQAYEVTYLEQQL